MNIRLLKVAKFLSKQGLYEEAALLKVIAMSDEDREAIRESLEGGDTDDEEPSGSTNFGQGSIPDKFFIEFYNLTGTDQLDHYRQLISFLNSFLMSSEISEYMNVNDIKMNDIKNEIMEDSRWAEIVKKLD